jgi:FtsH-binding integral membrane protein
MTLEKNDPAASIVEALRAESRYRTWFATVLAVTIAVAYLGSSFPFQLDQFPRLQPVGHFIAALILFAVSLGIAISINGVAKKGLRKVSGLAALSTPSMRRMLRDLNRVFGMRVVAVAFGGGQDGRMFAMKIKVATPSASGEEHCPSFVTIRTAFAIVSPMNLRI